MALSGQDWSADAALAATNEEGGEAAAFCCTDEGDAVGAGGGEGQVGGAGLGGGAGQDEEQQQEGQPRAGRDLWSAYGEDDADIFGLFFTRGRSVYHPLLHDMCGRTLLWAIFYGMETFVKMLLESSSLGGKYVDEARGERGDGWLINCLHGKENPSVRIVRLLLDAGVDARSRQTLEKDGIILIDDTPEEYVARGLNVECLDGTHVAGLRMIYQLLRQLPAVHATSWLWPTEARGEGVGKKADVAPTLSVLRRRAANPGVLRNALNR